MKNLSHILLLVLLSCAFVFTGCDDDDDPQASTVTLSPTSSSLEGQRGNTIEISVNAAASAGIQSLTVSLDGGAEEAIPIAAGQTAQTVIYSFDIPGNASLGTAFALLFKLTDVESNIAQTTVSVNIIALIDIPATYEFSRDGVSTVSYSGQTDRLNMLAEIKSKVLLAGDAGQLISEQVLLDAFANTGDNGGGLFSFSSDRQLKNKTFQPDLDDQLFENIFAEAAAASINGMNGIIATNGTAGLITREDKGSTILIDANGREFTQLVEKGLMGAVFFNQIYNVYLTDARTGDEVENTALREGKNYTDMEHHWDEAFGYLNPPLDFTSPWPEDRKGELRFWSNYSNVVDNVNNGALGTNKILMDAFIGGRAAIVNQDLTTKNEMRTILYDHLELVAAGTAVHYINLSIRFLNEGKTGELFHVLSEAWAFTNALRYSPNRKLGLSVLEEIMGSDFGAEGNFWNVTAEGLNTAKAKIVEAYAELNPVKDDL